MRKLKALYQKHREIVRYIFFGVMTTLVNLIVYQGLEWFLKPRWGDHSYLFSFVPGFIAALVFAFVVNKLYVFEKKSWEPRAVAKEAASFTLMRLFSTGLEYALLFVFNDLVWPRAEPWFAPRWQSLRLPVALQPDDAYRFLVRWGFIAVVVVLLNYIFSKWVIFRKEKEE